MGRTTFDAVSLIIEVDATITTDLAPFIEVANSMVTALCLDSGYTAAQLELIERWLTAHFYAIRDPRKDSEKAGSVGEKNQYKVDLNLNVTTYGQTAMLVDTAGNLSNLNQEALNGGSRSVGVTWLGTGNTDGDDISV